MDNICHTLVGAAIGECGGRKATPLATATLLIGANLPDLDALSYFGDHVTALGFRRGWTHGVLAVAVWPLLLTGAMLLFDRLVRRRRAGAAPVRPGMLLALAFLAVLSHPLLDLLNTYGVRLLMPFSGRWFYGDTLFIIDPWVWLALAAGILLSRVAGRRAGRFAPLPARAASGLVAAYIAAMALSGRAARREIDRYMTEQRALAGVHIMVAPEPLNPFRREVLLQVGGGYTIGAWDWRARPHLRGPWTELPSHPDDPEVRRAMETRLARTYLTWARYPVFTPGGREGCPLGRVCIRDARYYAQGWAEVAVPAGAPVSSVAPNPGAVP